jgi:hypothetical protein
MLRPRPAQPNRLTMPINPELALIEYLVKVGVSKQEAALISTRYHKANKVWGDTFLTKVAEFQTVMSTRDAIREAALIVCNVRGMVDYLDEYAFAKIKASVAIMANQHGEEFVLIKFLKNENFFDRDQVNRVINDETLLNKLKDQAAASLKRGNGCFVATAAFDGEDHPAVAQLRRYRDDVLKTTTAGRTFIWIYYRVGPFAGKIVRRSSLIKRMCRGLLVRFSRTH